MPSAKPAAKGGRKDDGDEARTPLQAVVLADSFTQRFRPISVERPKVLMPLVNAPMLDYTLEWLAYAGVEEVFVFCCAHAAQIEAYLESSKWTSVPNFAVSTIVSTDCVSVGEALRLVDQRNVIRSDFILISGDTVSNMKLDKALAEHRERRKADKLAVLTMITKPVSERHRTARLGEQPLSLVLDPTNKRLLHYDENSSGLMSLETALFSEHRDVQIRMDLLDCHIDICAPEVLYLFTDNFDYQHMRRDFVTGTLIERELGNKIFIHELGGEYAARVHNLRTFDAVSRDIVQRWVYPFCPDSKFARGLNPPSSYTYNRRNVYQEEGVTVARSAEIGADTVIGAGTDIGELTLVRKSVVGRRCRIGMRALIDGCHLHDNVVIGDHVQARGAIICAGAVVGPGAVIEAGAVISFNVVVGNGFRVASDVRLSLCRQPQAGTDDDSDDELEYKAGSAANGSSGNFSSSLGAAVHMGASGEVLSSADQALLEKAVEAAKAGKGPGRGWDGKWPWDKDEVGQGGAGFSWLAPERADDEWRFSIAQATAAAKRLELEEALAAEEPRSAEAAAGGASSSAAAASASAAMGGSDDSDAESDDDGEVDKRELHFRREVAETFLRCVREGFAESNVVVELQGLKMAENRTFADLARYILTTLLGLSLPAPPDCLKENRCLYPEQAPAGAAAVLQGLKPRIAKWAPLLRRFLKTEDDQVEMLLTFEEFCAEEEVFRNTGSKAYAAVFSHTLHLLYDADILSEEAILAWAEEKAGADESEKRFLNLAKVFIEWLQQSSEDESGEEEESSGEEEED